MGWPVIIVDAGGDTRFIKLLSMFLCLWVSIIKVLFVKNMQNSAGCSTSQFNEEPSSVGNEDPTWGGKPGSSSPENRTKERRDMEPGPLSKLFYLDLLRSCYMMTNF